MPSGLVLGAQRLSKKAAKASKVLCGAAGSGLVTAYKGAVLKTRWAWLLWARLLCCLRQISEWRSCKSIKMAVAGVFIA